MDSPGMKSRVILIALLFAAVLPFAYQTALFYDYTNDDAFITFRYSRNLAEGRGPYYNPGEHVEGYTNFLQMLQTAAVIKIAGPDAAPGIVRMLGVLFSAGCVLLAFFLFRGVFGGVRGAPESAVLTGSFLAAAAVAISPSFAVNATSALETGMFAFLLTLGVFLGLRETDDGRWRGAGIAFALALLTRPEGSLLFAVWWCASAAARSAVLRREKHPRAAAGSIFRDPVIRTLLLDAAIVTAVFLAHLAFRYAAYDGELLPNTFYAKTGGFGKIPAADYSFRGLFPPVLGLFGMALAAAGFIAGRKHIPARLAGVAALAAAGAFLPFLLGTDWMAGYRMMTPFIPAAAVTVTGGWMLLLPRMKRVSPAWLAAGAALVCALSWTTQDGLRKKFDAETSLRDRGYETGHRALARWLGKHAAPGDGVALMDEGLVGYLCPEQTIIDITGLTDRYIAKSPGAFLHKEYDLAYILDERRPRFIVLVFYSRGKSYTVPRMGAMFNPWAEVEERLFADSRFRERYMRESPAVSGEGDWLDDFAGFVGAEKVFEHGYPGRYYLLAVYERREPGAADGTADTGIPGGMTGAENGAPGGPENGGGAVGTTAGEQR